MDFLDFHCVQFRVQFDIEIISGIVLQVQTNYRYNILLDWKKAKYKPIVDNG